MKKYSEISFWTDESKFDKVRNMLMSKYSLVPPKNDIHNRTEKDILVWEDEQGIGMYRVHFIPEHPDGPVIYFRYWGGRLTPEIEKQDPMLEAVRKTYELIKPVNKTTGLKGYVQENIVGEP